METAAGADLKNADQRINRKRTFEKQKNSNEIFTSENGGGKFILPPFFYQTYVSFSLSSSKKPAEKRIFLAFSNAFSIFASDQVKADQRQTCNR